MSRRNVTIGFSEDEFIRIHGAAALARTPISTYLKWLLQGSPVDGVSKYMSVVLATLEEIKVAIASLPASPPAQPRVQFQGPPLTQRERFRQLMKDRGIPSSTIRQVDITLDEMENGR